MPYIPTPHVAFSHKTRALRHVLVKFASDFGKLGQTVLQLTTVRFEGGISVPALDFTEKDGQSPWSVSLPSMENVLEKFYMSFNEDKQALELLLF